MEVMMLGMTLLMILWMIKMINMSAVKAFMHDRCAHKNWFPSHFENAWLIHLVKSDTKNIETEKQPQRKSGRLQPSRLKSA